MILLLLGLKGQVFGVELMRLGVYQRGMNVTNWLASEMLDGVRAYWDGKVLYSRLGVPINIPESFRAELPPFAIDGELYTKKRDYVNISNIVMAPTPSPAWNAISYNVFDVPDAPGGLMQRLSVMERYLMANPKIKQIRIVQQIRIKSEEQLAKMFKHITSNGGEGVVVRDPDAPYIRAKSNKNLKYKAYSDAECEVVGVLLAEAGKSGVIDCRLPNGKLFKMSLHQKKKPPKVGDFVTYAYHSVSRLGLPQAPIYLHVRKD